MPKTIKIFNAQAPNGGKYVLLPIGMYCNQKLQKAEPDSVVEFRDGWQRDKRVLVRKCRVPVNSSVFTFLMKSIYGGISWEDLRRKWEAWAVVEGIGAQGISDTECLLIEVAPYDKEAYKAEQERKRLEAEARQKVAEREKTLKEIKKGTYHHPDVID